MDLLQQSCYPSYLFYFSLVYHMGARPPSGCGTTSGHAFSSGGVVKNSLEGVYHFCRVFLTSNGGGHYGRHSKNRRCHDLFCYCFGLSVMRSRLQTK